MSSSSSRPKVNLRSTAVKRIMQEASELADPQEDDFVAAPLETDIFEWHCTMRGVPGSEYDGGLYHLRIVLPPSYPMSAPDIMLLTPNGRFELNKKICIDGLTSFHAGSWQPAWGVRTAITGLRSFWMQGGEALSAVGALDLPKEDRRRLAKLSQDWTCPTCSVRNKDLLAIYPPQKQTQPAPVVDKEEIQALDVVATPPSIVPSSIVPSSIVPSSVVLNPTQPPTASDSITPADTSRTSHLPDRPPQSNGLTNTPPTQPVSRTTTITPRRPLWVIDAALVTLISFLIVLVAKRVA